MTANCIYYDLGEDEEVLVIADRLNTLNTCDSVRVLLKGRIEAFGPPEKLAREDAYYREALKLAEVH